MFRNFCNAALRDSIRDMVSDFEHKSDFIARVRNELMKCPKDGYYPMTSERFADLVSYASKVWDEN